MQWNKLENGANQTYRASGCYSQFLCVWCIRGRSNWPKCVMLTDYHIGGGETWILWTYFCLMLYIFLLGLFYIVFLNDVLVYNGKHMCLFNSSLGC